MKCPRCVQNVTPAAVSCPHCGYALGAACELYGSGSVVVERLMDVEGALEPGMREGVLEAIAEFDQRFPQLFLLVYIGPLPPPASPRQFAFWLLNHAAVADADAFHPNERGLLLVVDPKAGTAVLTAGYFLEPLVGQDELDRLLRSAGRDFARADYRSAIQALTSGLTPVLQSRAREARKNPEAFREVAVLPDSFPPLARTGEISVVEPGRPESHSKAKAQASPVPAKPREDRRVQPAAATPTGAAKATPKKGGRLKAKGPPAKRPKPRRR